MKTCKKCHISKSINDYYKRSSSKDGYRNECKECIKNNVKKWSKNNKDYIKAKRKEYYKKNSERIKNKVKKWRKDNPEKAKLLDKIKHEKTPSFIKKARAKKYRQTYPERMNARSSIYRRRKRKSKLYYLHSKDIYEFYKNCPDGYEVDHIIPISNKMISGLHVPWNLQYLSISENKKKSNKFDGTNNNDTWKKLCLKY